MVIIKSQDFLGNESLWRRLDIIIDPMTSYSNMAAFWSVPKGRSDFSGRKLIQTYEFSKRKNATQGAKIFREFLRRKPRGNKRFFSTFARWREPRWAALPAFNPTTTTLIFSSSCWCRVSGGQSDGTTGFLG
jgi:hypothetical protein